MLYQSTWGRVSTGEKKKSRQEKYFGVLKGVPYQQGIREWTSEPGRELRLSSLCILGLPWWLRW